MDNRHLRDLSQEMRDHIDAETADNIARGLSPIEARRQALLKFGNPTRIHEDTRTVWRPIWLEQLSQDMRYALRLLRRNPVFSVVVILSLGIGIGVNTAVFSVLNTILLRPLPYPEADRLVTYSNGVSANKAGRFKPGVLLPDFGVWQQQAQSFEAIAGYQYQDGTLTAANQGARAGVAEIAGDFWTITGAQPFKGRLLTPQDTRETAVISHGLYQRRFKSNPNIIGSVAELDGRPIVIAGVLPPNYRFLLPQERPGVNASTIDIYIPEPPLERSQLGRLFVVGKLKPAVSVATAIAELKTIQTAILKAHPDRWFPGVETLSLDPLQTRLAGQSREAILILQAAGLFVFLIACANIANLLLARAAARRREITIRTAIGAGMGRVVRQFFGEGLVVSALGAAAGLLAAKVFLALMATSGAPAIPRLNEAGIDARVVAFTIGIAFLAAIVFGLSPATVLWKTGRFRLQRFLVASELALAIILLAGAGLMVKSFWRMYAPTPGFEPANTLVMNVSLSGAAYKDKTHFTSYLQDLITRTQSLPGVQAAGIAERQGYLLQRADPNKPAVVDSFQESLVSLGYFDALGMRLLSGRWITETDAPDAAIINETMARRVFGTRDPIGQNITQLGRPVRVVGVAANLKYAKLDAAPGPELFRSYRQNLQPGNRTIAVVVRVIGDPLGLAATARSRVSSIDPSEPVYDIQSLEQALSQSIAPRRFNLFLLTLFAAAALVMAIVGIYGVISYSVTQRTREIGVRLAIGAQRSAIIRMVVKQGMALALTGILVGILAAAGLTRLMKSILYGVQPGDIPTFTTVAIALAITALVACAIPARRAARIEPMEALRHD